MHFITKEIILSKKKSKKIELMGSERQIWTMNPTQRVKQSKKIYDRNKNKNNMEWQYWKTQH